MKKPVLMQRAVASSLCSNGLALRVVLGANGPLTRRRRMVIWKCYNGLAPRAVRGMVILVFMRREVVIWGCSSGPASKVVPNFISKDKLEEVGPFAYQNKTSI